MASRSFCSTPPSLSLILGGGRPFAPSSIGSSPRASPSRLSPASTSTNNPWRAAGGGPAGGGGARPPCGGVGGGGGGFRGGGVGGAPRCPPAQRPRALEPAPGGVLEPGGPAAGGRGRLPLLPADGLERAVGERDD